MNDVPVPALHALAHRSMRRGSKLKWIPTSFRLPRDTHKWLKDQAVAENVDMTYLITGLIEQYRAFVTSKKIGDKLGKKK